ncbi:peptide chain release factor 2, putative [Plasmodium ovale]|uniref:Peptide chain release factor 2, putative n=1 Tax=Plasmodium ovale TaxID=36330 RepID=A0A1C3KN91_PLAOA|nr:peptide chain release factor 2, putative [Plasmodium ovale]
MFLYFKLPFLYINIFLHLNAIKCFVSICKNSRNLTRFTQFPRAAFPSPKSGTTKGNLHVPYLKSSSKNSLVTINKKLEDIGIFPKNIEETFVKGTGKGGQKVNKTNNCVMIKYCNDTGDKLVVKCHKYRCLQKNRIYARELLYSKITSVSAKIEEQISYQLHKEKSKRLRLTEKEKQESINYKKRRSEIKKSRQKCIRYEDDIM